MAWTPKGVVAATTETICSRWRRPTSSTQKSPRWEPSNKGVEHTGTGGDSAGGVGGDDHYGSRAMSELSYRDEAASAYDCAFAHVSTHFLPFLLRAGRLEPGQRVLDAATGTGIAAEAALAVVGPGA